MFEQLFRDLRIWVNQNAQAFWTGLGVLAAVWVALSLWLEYRWTRRDGVKVILGYPGGLRVLWGVLGLVILAGFLIAFERPFVGMFGAFAALPFVFIGLLFLVYGLVLGLALAVIVLLCRTRRLEVDPVARTWKLRRGWVFAPEVREGDYETLDAVRLEEAASWKAITLRVAVFWKDAIKPFEVFKTRIERKTGVGKLMLFATGLNEMASAVEDAVRNRAIKRMHGLAEMLDLKAESRPLER